MLCRHQVSCLLLILLLCRAASSSDSTVYISPRPSPRFHLVYDSASQTNRLQVNLTYVSRPDVLYTYVFGFTPWTQESNLFSPSNCTNRSWQQFNANNPIVWNNLWLRMSSNNFSGAEAVSGQYLSWPTPSLPWVVSATSYPTIQYDGAFTIEQLLSCAGDHILTTVTDDYFVYQGTFYVVWVQPVSPYLPGLPFTGTYSTRSYAFPFQVNVNRHADTIGGDPIAPSIIYAYVLEAQWETVLNGTGMPPESHRFHLLLQTKTPASLYTSGAIASYDYLSPLTTSLQPASSYQSSTTPSSYPLVLYRNEATSASSACVLDPTHTMCVQSWSFYSLPQYNISVDANDTYYLTAVLKSLPADGGNASTIVNGVTGRPLVASVAIQVDLFLDATVQVTQVNEFLSSLTLFSSTNFSQPRLSANYFATDAVVFEHTANLSPLSPNFYALSITDVYACATVPGGTPPYIGYDRALAMNRYGCAVEEYIQGVLNIPAASIFSVARQLSSTNQTSNYNFALYKLAGVMAASQEGASFALAQIALALPSAVTSTAAASPLYLQVDSILSEPTPAGPQTQGQEARQHCLASMMAQAKADAPAPLYTFQTVQPLMLTATHIAAVSHSATMSTGQIVGVSLSSAFAVFLVAASVWLVKSGKLASLRTAITAGHVPLPV